MLLFVSVIHSFLLPNGIPLYEYTTAHEAILLLVDSFFPAFGYYE